MLRNWRTDLSTALLICAGALFSSLPAGHAWAQTDTTPSNNTLITSGIDGVGDRKGRAPELRVRTSSSNGTVQILADAFVDNKEFRQWPLRFEFYVNRRLFSSQYRSLRLPGAIGVDIGPDVATVPFNYAVVVSMINPFGRDFSSIIEGTVFSSNLGFLLDCTVLRGLLSDSDSTEFVANDVQSVQLSNSSLQLVFEADEISGDNKLNTTLNVNIDPENNLNGSLSLVPDEDSAFPFNGSVTGSATRDDNGVVSELSVLSADGSIRVTCS